MFRFVSAVDRGWWLKFSLLAICTVLVSCGALERRSTSELAGDETEEPREVNTPPLESEYGFIPKADNRKVDKWINYFKGRGRRHMDRYLERSTRYLSMMKAVLREHGLPEDLIFVPLIESGFNSGAHSHASAVGYWQFIRSTGRNYGLRIDPFVDERRDPLLSTRAACEYFKALFNLFGDWYLALAAYNAGENRIKGALMRYRTRDFWDLTRRRRLPRETQNYVPKFLAARRIAKNPEYYGFTNVAYSPQLQYDVVNVEHPISLVKLGKEIGISYEALKKLNPRYRSDYVPIYRGKSSEVRVPTGLMDQAYSSVAASKADRPTIVMRDYFWYRVRRGDTLSTIARRYRTRMSTIRRLNRMGRRRSFLRIGQRLKIPQRYPRSMRVQQVAKKKKSRYVPENTFAYRVRRGDTLSQIAEAHGVGLSQLRRVNRLGRRSLLRVGQAIRIPGEASKVAKATQGNHVAAATKPVGAIHRVQRGENLSVIADRYGLSVQELRKLNNLGRRSLIKVGQELKVKDQQGGGGRQPNSTRRNRRTKKRIHIVRRGENLSSISKRYGIPMRRIIRKNGIRNRSKIAAGQRLVIPIH